ncbi:MAG: hypothetical protein WC621_05165 [Patescibacteria group bacterium]
MSKQFILNRWHKLSIVMVMTVAIALSGYQALAALTFDATSVIGSTTLSLSGAAGSAITVGDAAQTGTISVGTSTGAMTLNLGTGNSTKTVAIGTGTGIDTINIGTGGTLADIIRIGDSVADLALTDAQWGITTAGAATFVTVNGNTISTGTGTLTIGGTGSLITTGSFATTLASSATATLTLPGASGTLATLAGTETLSGKTLTAPKFADLGFIADESGAKLLSFNSTTTPVNYMELSNSPANTALTFWAKGASTNLSLTFQTKGTGTFSFYNDVALDDTIVLAPKMGGGAAFSGIITTADLTAEKTYTFPDATGGVVVATNSATATQALFATATSGAPAFRAIALTDLPTQTGTGNIVLATAPSVTTLTVASGGASITGGLNNNAGGITNAGAISGASSGAFSGVVTLSGNDLTILAVTGVPADDATSSLVQLGPAIAGGSAIGTYLGSNPATFTGDFINLQVAGASKFKVTNAGVVTAVTFVGALTGNASTATSATSATSATTATHIAGGAAGSLPYQTGAGATSLLGIGTASQVLRVNAGATAPEWVTFIAALDNASAWTVAQKLDAGITVDTTNFTVDGTTGAVHTAGNFDVATNKFTVAAASGDTLIAGTLGVTGAITGSLTGNAATVTNGVYTTNKDATGGVAGLTLFKINFKNAANTFTNFFTNTTTAARTYTFQDRDGTIADDTDLALKANIASPTFTGTVTIPTPFTLGAVSVLPTGTELNFVDGVTSAIQTQLDAKQGTLTNSAGLLAALSDETGTGLAAFNTNPTFAGQTKKSVQAGITAFATGGQTNAVAITADIAEVTTVGTAADSVKLPVAVAGMQITVINKAATNSMGLFPGAGGNINEAGLNLVYNVAAKVKVICTAIDAVAWECQKMAR